MIRAAIMFFVVGLLAYLLGAGGVAGMSVEIGKMLLFVFLIISAMAFIASLFMGRKVNRP